MWRLFKKQYHPFSDIELVGLSSVLVLTEKVEKDLLEAEMKEEEELKKFIEKRPVDQT